MARQLLINTFTILFFLFFFNTVYGQDNKKAAQSLVDMADEILRYTKAIDQAREYYANAAQLDPENIRANFLAGKYHLETVNKDHATEYFLNVYKIDPNYRFDIYYLIGRGYHFGLDFEKALEYYDKYKKKLVNNKSYRGPDRISQTEVERRIIECYNGIEIVSRPTEYSIENVGSRINSEWPDYAPVINEDETVMIFTSRRQEDNTNENVYKDNLYYEDIYISKKKDGKWGSAKNIGKYINTPYHDSNLALSADGKTLYIYKDDGLGDIYFSDEQPDGTWSKPEPFSSKVNSQNYSEKSFTITKDRKVLFFSSNRPGGYGGYDIYMCVKDSKGEWGRTYNLGPIINTPYDEDGAFLDYDGKTLYFSSKGHKGYGGFDIFKSVYDSLTQQWTIPENLGYPINTPDDEVHFVSTKDGKRGYFASVREEGHGFTDIYMVNFHGAPKERKKKFITDKQPFDQKILEKINQVYFDINGSKLKAQDFAELDKVIALLHTYKSLGVEISGFASTDGNPKHNLDLSNKRAMEVFSYFTSKGINEDRIIAKGYGAVPGKDPLQSRRADIQLFDLSKYQ
jgi:outer membrane protein OmpA-like peptidoglycan-associated protein/tetratricopeptide (TPR) repeat protein